MGNLLEYKEYYGSVEFSGEDDVFFGKIEGINDLVSFEGQSVSELKQAFHESVDEYLAFCKDLGKNPDKTFKGVFNVRVSAEIHKALYMISVRKNKPLNAIIKKGLNFLVNNEDAVLK